jgi:hypothetical protein
MSYRDDVGSGFAALVGFIVVCAVIGLVTLVGWQVGWWFHTQDTNRQAQLDKQGVGYQLPLQQQIGDEIGQVLALNTRLADTEGSNPGMVGVLDAQRKATVTNICQKAAQVNPATPLQVDQAQFVTENCTAGAINPGSVYNH